MRWISLPEELALPYLLELQGVQRYLRNILSQVQAQLHAAEFESALQLTEQAYTLAYRRGDRAGEAWSLLLRAGVLWRLGRWGDVLDTLHRAISYLELQVSTVARYHEAVAAYLEGLVHWILRANDKVVETFAYAHEGLVASERHWGFEQNTPRVAACRDVIRWMSRILELSETLNYREITVIIPVYELVKGTWFRTDAMALHPCQIRIPAKVVAQYLPSDYVPVELDTLPFMQLDPGAVYLGVRIPADSQMLSQGRRGDVLLVETVVPCPLEDELVLTYDKPFMRRSDGRVEFRPAVRDSAGAIQGMVGIPRMLIKEGEEEES